MSQKLALLVRLIHGFLQSSPVFSFFPLSLLLIGFEELLELKAFACPCRHDLNQWLISSIFIGPPFFIFALMYLVLRPFKHDWFPCSQRENDDRTQRNWPKALAHCLMPSLIWVVILLLDGDFIACAMTKWKGVYVFDQELNRLWCKPTAEMSNETELRDLFHQYIHQSRISGYFITFFLSLLTITSVVIYDCCICGRCDGCCHCGRTAQTKSEEQGSAKKGQELQELGTSATTEQQVSGSSATKEQQESGTSATMEQQESGSPATVRQKQQESGSSATAQGELDSSDTAGQGKNGLGCSSTAGQQKSWSSAPMGSTTMTEEQQSLLSVPHQGQYNDSSSMQMSIL